jgi:hypothetical protein
MITFKHRWASAFSRNSLADAIYQLRPNVAGTRYCEFSLIVAQIRFQCAARLEARVHLRFEEAICPTPIGLSGVHRQIGAFQKKIEIATVVGRKRNADARIGRELMAETFKRFTNSLEDAYYQICDIRRFADGGLNDGKLIATETCDQIGIADAVAQAAGHNFQILISDCMSQRIIDAFEFVDVDIKHRKLFAPVNSLELPLHLFAEQYPVRQVG